MYFPKFNLERVVINTPLPDLRARMCHPRYCMILELGILLGTCPISRLPRVCTRTVHQDRTPTDTRHRTLASNSKCSENSPAILDADRCRAVYEMASHAYQSAMSMYCTNCLHQATRPWPSSPAIHFSTASIKEVAILCAYLGLEAVNCSLSKILIKKRHLSFPAYPQTLILSSWG